MEVNPTGVSKRRRDIERRKRGKRRKVEKEEARGKRGKRRKRRMKGNRVIKKENHYSLTLRSPLRSPSTKRKALAGTSRNKDSSGKSKSMTREMRIMRQLENNTFSRVESPLRLSPRQLHRGNEEEPQKRKQMRKTTKDHFNTFPPLWVS